MRVKRTTDPVTISPADLEVARNVIALAQTLERVLGAALQPPSAIRAHSQGKPVVSVSQDRQTARQTVHDAPGSTFSHLVVYWPADARRRPEGLTAVQQDAYDALLKTGKHLSAYAVAALAKRPTESTRRSLNVLVDMKVLRRGVEAVK